MTSSTTDSIRKDITLKAPLARVWKALTDSAEFGQWFRVDFDGPFVVGETIAGQITYPGCEHMRFLATVERMDAQRVFAFRWDPRADEDSDDPNLHVSTLVEFTLEEVEGGVHLTVLESGFDSIPADKRAECLERNEGGWVEQMENIRKHVDG
ncbi:MAG: SRPBCC family protein [Planctomycetota bacterium]|jgi:uncharacterized protein YndB with AHSA1/START domain